MKNSKTEIQSIILGTIIGVLFGYLLVYFIFKCISIAPAQEFSIEVKKQPSFFNKSPEEGLVEALEYYEIQYPQIVYAQALLETGHFTSSVCKKYNNLFGLYNSKIKDYYSFEHWSDSVRAYRDYVQYKYKGNTDYYTFLVNLPYATDPNYIRKIKQLEHRYLTYSNMEQNNKIYYKVDVTGKHGYSFMVSSNDILDESEVLDKALAKGLFQDELDADYAIVDNIISDHEIEVFKDCTYEID